VQQEPMSFDEAKSIVKEALAAKMPAYTVEERKELMARMDRRVERMNREEGEVEETAREHEEEATALTNVEEKSADFIEAREEAVAAREKEVAAQEEELAAEKKALAAEQATFAEDRKNGLGRSRGISGCHRGWRRIRTECGQGGGEGETQAVCEEAEGDGREVWASR